MCYSFWRPPTLGPGGACPLPPSYATVSRYLCFSFKYSRENLCLSKCFVDIFFTYCGGDRRNRRPVAVVRSAACLSWRSASRNVDWRCCCSCVTSKRNWLKRQCRCHLSQLLLGRSCC